jgi:hypothetical protein
MATQAILEIHPPIPPRARSRGIRVIPHGRDVLRCACGAEVPRPTGASQATRYACRDCSGTGANPVKEPSLYDIQRILDVGVTLARAPRKPKTSKICTHIAGLQGELSLARAWAFPSAREEARHLVALVRNGETIASVRELIGVSPPQESELRSFAEKDSGNGKRVLAVISWRCRVLDEFDLLVVQ